ncbi:uncharacterized protein LOC120329030 [Styela clava]
MLSYMIKSSSYGPFEDHFSREETSEFISERAMTVLSRAAKRNVCKQQLMLMKSSSPWKQMTPRENARSAPERKRFSGKRSLASSAPPMMRQPPQITIEEASVERNEDNDDHIGIEENEISAQDPIYCASAPPTASSLNTTVENVWEARPPMTPRQQTLPQYPNLLTRPKYQPVAKPLHQARPSTTDWDWVRSKLLSRDSVKRPESSMTFDDFLNGLDPDSDEYDTDLEDAYYTEEHEPYDPTGIWHYEKLCKIKGTVPARQVVEKLGNKHIQFRLNHRYIGTKDSEALANGLKNNDFIEDLDLSDNCLSDRGGQHVAKMMRQNRQVYRLDLSSNCLQCDAGRYLAQMLLYNRHLTTLCLKKNKLGDKEALLLAEVLRVNRSLKSLDISHNQLGDNAGEAFSAALMDNKTLRSFNLSWNSLCKRAAAAIARALDINTTLFSLDLSYNGLGDDGAALLGHALRENSTLRFLSLAVNHICGYGAEQLATGVSGGMIMTRKKKKAKMGRTKCGLQYLNLDRNPLGIRGIKLLLQRLSKEKTLKTLSIREVVLNDDLLKQIRTLKTTSSKEITLLHEGQDQVEQTEASLMRGIRVLNTSLESLHVKIIDVVNALDNRGIGANVSDLRNVLAEHTSLTELEIEYAVKSLDINNDDIVQYKDIAIHCRGS